MQAELKKRVVAVVRISSPEGQTRAPWEQVLTSPARGIFVGIALSLLAWGLLLLLFTAAGI
jgi:hypothetical protein